ncbi:hypothetical protein V5O48_001460 [Marasmius crinis-equi]|uniref:Cytochrome P450 n=1 Tax=Marasmius crinis-equi TaxID=585013 RepID=A0ABR3FYC9_9AGAR
MAKPPNVQCSQQGFEMPEDFKVHRHWSETYRRNMKAQSCIQTTGLWTWDCKVMSHILKNDQDYRSLDTGTYRLSCVVGNGILAADGDRHALHSTQNPAFGLWVRKLTDIFLDKSIKMRDSWADIAAENLLRDTVDVMPWIQKLTLDIIGEAGEPETLQKLECPIDNGLP